MFLILDDHPLSRQGLFSLIKSYRNDEELLQTGTVLEAIDYTKENEVDIAFIDLNLGKESGFDYIKWVKSNKDNVKTIIITSSSRHSDFSYAQELGVDAYVLKDSFIDEIVYGLSVVERGGRFYSASLMEKLNKISEDEKALKKLSDRELDVFMLIGMGYSNSEISKKLYITEGTTKKHISSIFSKLNLSSRVDAVLMANSNTYSVKTSIDKSIKEDSRREMKMS